jgi:hypothetical protein
MSIVSSNILAGASGQGGGYNLTNSLRFRSSANAYLNRTGGTSTNRRIHTFSFWTKYSVTGGTRVIASAGSDDNNREWMGFDSNNFYYQVKDSGNFYELGTTQVLRDPSAWYHLMVAVDTTQATSSNRVKMYINGVQVTAFGTATYPPQNDDLFFNDSNGGVSYIGALRGFVGSTGQYDGYLAEFNFIDGQQLTPSSFGETSTTTGVWIPKKYTGTYGTNGFYLPFTDNSALTTSSNVGLGKDFSGNANYWVTNNISITSGSTYDSMTDVPTLTSATAGNYCVINPLANSGIGTLSRGNLQLVTSTNSKAITGTMALPSTGQYYWEITATDYITDNGTFFGVVNKEFLTGAPSNGTWLGFNTYNATYDNGTTTDTNGLTGTNVTNDGDIWCIAIDVTNNKFWIGRSRSGTLVWADGVTPAVNGSGASTLSLPTGNLYPMAYRGGSDNETYNFNFGQQPFAHTPPTGFVRLNTFNLPTPTIGATAATTANKYMNIALYTGTGSSQSITGLGFQPDWTWIKGRSGATDHGLYDAVRGVQNQLESNTTTAETAEATGLTAFGSDGFTVGALAQLNTSSATYVAWNWKANGAGSSNTAGTITSTVSANTSAGFSIVTYTGNNTASTVGHGLGVAPSMYIVKLRSTTGAWGVYHSSLAASQVLYLNTTDAVDGSGIWNSTAPTSSVFSIGAHPTSNPSGQTLVAYCFAQVAGYSAFGSYTGNASTDGTFVFTGFRPRFILVKSSSNASTPWQIFDTSINPYNTATNNLIANGSTAEPYDTASPIDFLSNGFKLRGGSSSWNNYNTGTWIYAVFAETPFKYANAR